MLQNSNGRNWLSEFVIISSVTTTTTTTKHIYLIYKMRYSGRSSGEKAYSLNRDATPNSRWGGGSWPRWLVIHSLVPHSPIHIDCLMSAREGSSVGLFLLNIPGKGKPPSDHWLHWRVLREEVFQVFFCGRELKEISSSLKAKPGHQGSHLHNV